MTAPVSSAPVYGDFAGLESLKKAARSDDPAAIRQVAKQFESLFAHMLIKSMRDAVGRDPIFGSDQEQTYQEMYDDQLSLELTRGHGLGLADMLVRQLQHKGVTPGAHASGTGAAPAAGSGFPVHSGVPSRGAGGLTGAAETTAVPHASRGSASHQPAAASSAEQKRFISEVWPQAQQAAGRLGVAPESLVAQAALETNWGRNVPHDGTGQSSNNLFGLKASDGWSGPSVTAATHEFVGGTAHATTAQFRTYGDRKQGFQDYVAVLTSNPRYAAALDTGGNAEAFASALQRGGYATDPAYASKISAIAGEVTNALKDPAMAALRSSASGESLKLASAAPITSGTDSLL